MRRLLLLGALWIGGLAACGANHSPHGVAADATGTPDGPGCPQVDVPAPVVHLALDEATGQGIATAAPRAIRAVWEHGYGIPADQAAGSTEIATRVQRMRAAGINSVSFLVSSLYMKNVASAPWDMFGAYIDAVRAAGMEVHIWYSPMILKEPSRANELVDHPEWKLTSFNLTIPDAVDLASDAARAYEVQVIAQIATRYHPDAIELEETFYHNAGATGSIVPTDAAFAQLYLAKYGYPPTTSRPTRPDDVAALKREIITGFFSEARAGLQAADPAVALHSNVATIYAGDPALATTGYDLPALRDQGLIDAFVPQLYYNDATLFGTALAGFETAVGGRMSIIGGLSTRLGTAGTVNAAFFPELARAERVAAAGSAGSSTFAYLYLDDVRAGLDARPMASLDGMLGKTTASEPSDPMWTDGPSAGSHALAFDGVDDMVTVPGAYALDEYGELTIATWLRFDGTSRAPHETLLSRGPQSSSNGFVWLFRTADGRLAFEYSDGAAYHSLTSDVLTIDDGAWHHIAVVQDHAAHAVRFYVDGVARGTATYTGRSVPAVTGSLWLGTYGDTGTADYAFHGALSDVRWYRRALSADQIAALACGSAH